MVIIIILAYTIIGILEIAPLIADGRIKDLILFMLLFVPAFVISLLLSLGVEIPMPEQAIQMIVEAVIGEQ